MKTIGIRELKATLSRILRDVAAGDVYLVTDRGHVVAELRRPDASQWTGSSVDQALQRLAARGVLRLAERPKFDYRPSAIRVPAGTVQRLIDEEREE